jgi:broad specificity phosphatase PhoE
MEIFLVRHGQTIGNVARRHQADATPLSDLGRQQADEVALKIKELRPTHLVSSHLIRAIETARPISRLTGLDMEIIHDFEELRRPKYLGGRKHFGPHSVFYYLLWFLGIENESLAGESYYKIRQRIAMAQNHLKRYPDDARVVVVSHSVFINLFLAHMCRPSALLPFSAAKFFISVLRIPNGQIIHVSYAAKGEGKCKWSVQPLDENGG